MTIQIKTRGRWRDMPASQWDFAVWAVANALAVSAATAREQLRVGKRILVEDFGGAYVRGGR